ncbi:response regulator transcription factor [Candidatus Woesearchaeota archaeon]|nr:response regulator transcription factor [Candidatus Woesearchaeota archaeon]
MKVLVVEDSIVIAGAIKVLLTKESIDVISTNDGSKVVDIMKKEGIDLVILDLMMPNVSGKDVFKMLKSDESTKNVKIMILTARPDALKWNPELRSCDKFMTKPFDNKELVAEVKKLIPK